MNTNELKKIGTELLGQSKELKEIFVCSNGAAFNKESDAQAFQRVCNPHEEVVCVKRSEKIAAAKTAEQLTAEIAELEAKTATLKGAPKAAVQKKIEALKTELEAINNK